MRAERILVIDDEPIVTALLSRYLEQEGFICHSASDADEALQQFRQGSFSAALVDIRMQGKDGITLLGEMKALDPDLATIMVTAVKDRESAVRAMKLGAEDYIVKPFNLEEVLTSLHKALEKRRLTLENRVYHQELERLVAERTRDLEGRNRELAALNAVATTVTSTLHLQEVLEAIQERVAGLLGEKYPPLFSLFNERDETFEIMLTHVRAQALRRAERLLGIRFEGFSQPLSELEPARREALLAGKPYTTNDGSEFLRSLTSRKLIKDAQRAAGVKCIIDLPLWAKGKLIGSMILLSQKERTPDREIELLSAIASQAAIAIENAQLYQEALEEKRKVDTILSEAFTGIMVVDTNLHLREFNPAAETITGYQANEVLGHSLTEFFGLELYRGGSLLHQAIAGGEQIPPTETVVLGARGRRDILLAVTPLPAEGSGPTQYLLSFADVTELKEAERLKTNLVANVSHELRSPLASIRAYTELLMENLDEGDVEVRQHFLEVIDQEAQHLADLITDLLNVARLESGGFEPHMLDVSLRDVAEETLARFQVQAQQRGIQLVLDVPSDLPHVLADPEMMGILFKNLVSNSIKFSPQGGEVKVSLRADEECHTLEVTDQGIGIAPEDLPRMFQKFYRPQRTIEGGFEGTGLGLTLVKEVVEAHGGTIEIQSELAKGTRFTIALPLKPSLPGPDGPEMIKAGIQLLKGTDEEEAAHH